MSRKKAVTTRYNEQEVVETVLPNENIFETLGVKDAED